MTDNGDDQRVNAREVRGQAEAGDPGGTENGQRATAVAQTPVDGPELLAKIRNYLANGGGRSPRREAR